MNIIQGGRWDNFLRRYFSMKQGVISPEVSSELQPIVTVQEWSPELYALRQERLMTSAGFSAAGGAGRESVVEILNPAGSNTLLIIEGYKFWINALMSWGVWIIVGPTAIGAPLAGATQARDGRQSTEPVAQVTTGDVATLPVAGTQVDSGNNQTNDSFETRRDIIIPPGQAFFAGNFTANQAFNFDIFWRERQAEPAELVGI